MRSRRFFFHYNKPESKKRGYPVITVHIGGKCHLVQNIKVDIPTRGRIRVGAYPSFVMVGDCTDFRVVDDTAYLR